MRNTFAVASLLLGLVSSPSISAAQTVAREAPAPGDPLAWWREARFGMFIHWGLYAIPAGEWNGRTNYGEWIRHSAQIPIDEYAQFQARWNPTKFDADAWMAIARDAGMRYVVITSKHHDGFCLWDSELTTWDVANTPHGVDILAEIVRAARAHDIVPCFYHSILDWHHPDYLPRRAWESRPSEGASYERYVAYLRAQVTELLTNYGKLGVLWFDGEWEGTWTSEHGRALYDLCKRLQPDVLVNNRVDKGRGGMAGMTLGEQFAGDFGTPEQEIPATGLPGVDWETCMTMNRHWGWNRRDDAWKSSAELIRMLVDIASKGGNFLLNVGPRPDGTFPPECVERLRDLGAFMRVNGEAIYGTQASPLPEQAWGRCTHRKNANGDVLYLHVFDWPADGVLHVHGLGNVPRALRLLGSGRAVGRAERDGDGLRIQLPGTAVDPVCSVVALELAEPVIAFGPPTFAETAPLFLETTAVALHAPSEHLIVRVTLDGREPSATSPRYEAPLRLTDTTTVRARCFFEGRPVADVVERTFTRVAPRPAGSVEDLQPGLRFTLHRGTWDRIPDFDGLPIVERGIAATPRDLRTTGERVGARLEGQLRVPTTAVHELALLSDDGSRLFVGEELLIDNDGLHGPESVGGVAALAAGWHPIRIEWFNKTGGAELQLSWKIDGAWHPIPAAAFAHRR